MLRYSGLSLIEFMITVLIGSVISLAAFNMMTEFEEGKRAVTTSGEADLAGIYVLDRLDRDIRSSGSAFTGGGRVVSGGIAKTYQYFYGCRVTASDSGVAVLPAPQPFPVPFANVPQNVRLAPVIIFDGGIDGDGNVQSDVIMVARGGGSHVESVQTLAVAPSSAAVTVSTGIGIRASDLLLLAPTEVTGSELSGADCVITEVDADLEDAVGSNVSIPLQEDGDHYRDPEPLNIGALAVWANLGQAMRLRMYGIDQARNLLNYDLLAEQVDGVNPGIISENLVTLQALYGIDNGAGVQWVSATGDYSAANLLDGSAAATQRLINIQAVRVAVIVQTSQAAREAVSTDERTLFQAAGQPLVIALPDENLRYNVMESIIPVRNVIGLRGG